MKQTTDLLSPKEVSIMNKSNLHNKRLQSLKQNLLVLLRKSQ